MKDEVTQEDREAAAVWTKMRCRGLGLSDDSIKALTDRITAGHADDDDLVQAFKNHRLAAIKAAEERATLAEQLLSRALAYLPSTLGEGGDHEPT